MNQKMEVLDDILRKPAFKPETGVTRPSVLEGLEAAGARTLTEPMVQDVMRMALQHFRDPANRRQAFAVAQGAALMVTIKNGDADAARTYLEKLATPLERRMVLQQLDQMARSDKNLTPEQSEALMRFHLANTSSNALRKDLAEKKNELGLALVREARQKGYATAAAHLDTFLQGREAAVIPKPVGQSVPQSVPIKNKRIDRIIFHSSKNGDFTVTGTPAALQALREAKESTNAGTRRALMERIARGEYDITFQKSTGKGGMLTVRPTAEDLPQYALAVFDRQTWGEPRYKRADK